jgi:hypothetical protein
VGPTLEHAVGRTRESRRRPVSAGLTSLSGCGSAVHMTTWEVSKACGVVDLSARVPCDLPCVSVIFLTVR